MSRSAPFEHECPDWDFLRIAADDPEFASCTCFTGPEAEAAYRKAQQLVENIGAEMSPFEIARVAYEVNRAYRIAIGEAARPVWEEATIEVREGVSRGVHALLMNAEESPEDTHKRWMADRTSNGWVYGEKEDVEKKTHPSLKPYAELSVEQRVKDTLFRAVVLSLRDH